MYSRLRTAISIAAMAAVAGACGSDSPTQPATQQITLTQALAELSLPALNTARATFGGVTEATPALTAARCPYNSAAQSFVCSTVNSGGLTIDQSFTLLTSGGASQSAFDAATTDAVKAVTAIGGSYTASGITYTADGDQVLTLSGLQGSTHSIDGTGSITVTADDGTNPPLTLTLTETIAALKIPAASSSATVWPSSGTITLTSVADLGGGTTSTTTVTMTFNGTSTVHVVVVSDGATSTCDVDFASPNPSCG
jgi:hypothetical protein